MTAIRSIFNRSVVRRLVGCRSIWLAAKDGILKFQIR
nr:MAG TPA: hypothetical protein [Inoviridae sp.]